MTCIGILGISVTEKGGGGVLNVLERFLMLS